MRHLPQEGAFFSHVREDLESDEPKPKRRAATAAEIAAIFGMRRGDS